MKVYLSTLGCKLNESELEAWARRFAADGYEIVDDARNADVCVLNTCTVTHVAARKSRQIARQMARANPHARIVLTGCYTDIAPDEAKRLPNVALVVPNAEKDRLVQQVAGFMLQVSDCSQYGEPNSQITIRKSQLRTRAFVKIQDGCNMSCAYCIIPLARGKERSRSCEEIVTEVQSLVDAGYQEIILTGVQISAYREGGADYPFVLRDLVAAILSETNVPRLRLTSIAPWDLVNGLETDESLLDLWSDARLCRHLHLSLQSGSDTVLRRMRRPYTTAQFARAVEITRAKIPDVGITTDVIVGFPGESEVEFEQSRDFVARMQFSRVHVFPYSARAGTLAVNLPLQVADAVKESRAKQMQTIADASAHAFARRFLGRAMDVLWESREEMTDDLSLASRRSPPVWSGYTDNYVRVTAASDANLHNQIVSARILDVAQRGDGVIAEIPANPNTL
ncbi:Threonylcarbamoyladenosine tRNA methylthiotransferase MtaB [Anaerolineae bacterium]|nr:Threonylcarbamoyladenosine tRNA methylthiotransferase MtaB [Anaerolineae bacterium]